MWSAHAIQVVLLHRCVNKIKELYYNNIRLQLLEYCQILFIKTNTDQHFNTQILSVLLSASRLTGTLHFTHTQTHMQTHNLTHSTILWTKAHRSHHCVYADHVCQKYSANEDFVQVCCSLYWPSGSRCPHAPVRSSLILRWSCPPFLEKALCFLQ